MARKKKPRKRRVDRRRYPKRNRESTSRNYKSPIYSRWREDVKERDGHCCQWPNCGSKHRLEVHHIKTWSQYPGLRYASANGITLCWRCHNSIKGREADYEAYFLKLLEWQMLDKLKRYKKD